VHQALNQQVNVNTEQYINYSQYLRETGQLTEGGFQMFQAYFVIYFLMWKSSRSNSHNNGNARIYFQRL